jgi:hypothetical protein
MMLVTFDHEPVHAGLVLRETPQSDIREADAAYTRGDVVRGADAYRTR